MKHMIRDWFVWFCYRVGVVKLWQRQSTQPLVRVLAFHDVADGVWFASLIDTLRKRYHILSPADFESRTYKPEKINLLLTFDDGYDSWVTNVVPVMQKYNLSGIFFVSTGIIESANDVEKSARFMREQLLIAPKKPLTREGLQTLHQSGQMIGGHTHSHVSLRGDHLPQAKAEILDNKQLLENQLDIEVKHFAYPFGTRVDFSTETTSLLRQLGFTYVYTAVTGFVGSDQSEIPRTLVEKNQSIESVCRWIAGGYDIFARIIAWLKK